MQSKNQFKIIVLLGSVGCLVLLGYISLPIFFQHTYSLKGETIENNTQTVPLEPAIDAVEKAPVLHVDTPEKVLGVYVTACAAATPSYKNSIIKLLEETELNSVIIDIKDFSGTISIPTDNPLLADGLTGKGCKVKDMEEFVAQLHEMNVYVIGRVTVFQDPLYAKLHNSEAIKRVSDGGLWADKNGLNYLYPGSEKVWDYVIEIAKESYSIGFDEINFDYIRFPSDGDIKNMAIPTSGLTKADIVENFFSYLNANLKDTDIVTSADLFGMTTTNTDDLGIGQILERTLPYFDYVCPMVYPSHYPAGFNGWSNPNSVPYDLINFVMKSSVDRANALKNDLTQPEWLRDHVSPDQLRPWLQNFSLGKPPYGATEIDAQIRATNDVGLDSWLLWDASNKYTNTKSALAL
jgi:hypothetical protein